MWLAGPIFVRFVSSVHGTVCPKGQTEPQCSCSGPSQPQSPPHLPGLSLRTGKKRERHKKNTGNIAERLCSKSVFY